MRNAATINGNDNDQTLSTPCLFGSISRVSQDGSIRQIRRTNSMFVSNFQPSSYFYRKVRKNFLNSKI